MRTRPCAPPRHAEHRVGEIERAGARPPCPSTIASSSLSPSAAGAERAAAFRAADRAARRPSSYTIPCYTFVLMPRLSAPAVRDRVRVVLTAACSEPPQKEIDRAQQAIDAARAAGAEQVRAGKLRRRDRGAASRRTKRSISATTGWRCRARSTQANVRRRRRVRPPTTRRRRAAEPKRRVNAANAALMQLEARFKVAEEMRVPARELAPARATRQGAEAALQKARALLAPRTTRVQPRPCQDWNRGFVRRFTSLKPR